MFLKHTISSSQNQIYFFRKSVMEKYYKTNKIYQKIETAYCRIDSSLNRFMNVTLNVFFSFPYIKIFLINPICYKMNLTDK